MYRTSSKLLVGAALLVLSLATGASTAEAQTTWNIFTTQTPTETLDAAPGWEVGTRFSSSKAGKVIGFRFWRASGETGSNYAKLWTNTGTKLATSSAFPSGTGWVETYLNNPVSISANTTYRLSVNTNTKQVKKGGAYVFDGHIYNGPLFSDSGYYGQPLNAMPTAESASMYFVDVIFEETVPKPDLYISNINPFSGSNVVITVCNQGAGNAGTSYTRLAHWAAPLPTGQGQWLVIIDLYTPAIAAGQCTNVSYGSSSPVGYHNEYHVDADSLGGVSETSETNNRLILYWNR